MIIMKNLRKKKKLLLKKKNIKKILYCGKKVKKMNPFGKALGVAVDLDGI